jgi:hypothetical protein
MKITLRILCPRDVQAVVSADPMLAEKCPVGATAFELDAAGAAFERFLEITADAPSCWLNPVFHFGAAELEAAAMLQVEGRGKIVRESPTDHEINARRLESLDVAHPSGAGVVRLLDRMSLRAPSLKPDAFACAGDWSQELVVPDAVFALLERAGLRGAERRPIEDGRSGRTYAGFSLLYSSAILPACDQEASDLRQADAGERRLLGCLVYPEGTLAPAADFCRTAEALAPRGTPLWVVSQEVRALCRAQAVRGVAFRPVYEKGTRACAQWREDWTRLVDAVESRTRHRF